MNQPKKLSDLAPNPNNPRTITPDKLKMLEASILEFGSLDGMIYNRRTQRLIGAHQRQKAFPNSEITIQTIYPVPTDKGTCTEGYVTIEGEKFPYREVDWDEAKEMAANIAANKGAGQWDFPKLSEWMLQLDDLNLNLDLTMFDESERDRLLGGWDSSTESVDLADENLDGITATIKIKCPQEIYDEVTIFLKAKLMETSFTGVEIV